MHHRQPLQQIQRSRQRWIVHHCLRLPVPSARRFRIQRHSLAPLPHQVRFIDSAGLAALVGAANRAAAHGGSLHVVCARPQIRQLFRLTGLDRRLAPARTLDEALDAVVTARRTPG